VTLIAAGGTSRIGHVRSQPLFLTLTLACLTCAMFAGCTVSSTPRAARPATAPPTQSLASGLHVTWPLGTPGRPLMLSCSEQSVAGPVTPGPGDVVVGPLYILNARNSGDPSGAGSAPQHGYKYPIAVAPGATVTMMIAASARGHVVIDNPYGPPAGVVAASYRACQPGQQQGWTVFVQGFTFTDGRTRGCVPLTVRIGRDARIRHVTVSLYAGPCAS
jgi:hypothetical protein